MNDVDVVVKGEYHSSKGDLAHERELLVEGVDHLILEGPAKKAEYGILQQWYAFAMLVTDYLFFRVFNTDTSVLEDITKAQDGDVVKTRESDVSILENSHILVRIFAAFLFFLMMSITAVLALAEIHLYGASLLILSVMIPPLVLRAHESTRSAGSREEIMAEKITDAAERGGRVIAVVGESHADDVCEHLPEWIKPEREDPVYPWYSWRHMKDVGYPTFVFISVLWVFYTIFATYVELAWSLT